ncbi:AAA family ATPase [Thioclava sp. GXIMD4215]|uniref:AAA family ATPase n=1 Tax=Thioclava sp. GXIMD4215 TaxID=3131928 RepID=UPI00324EE37A
MMGYSFRDIDGMADPRDMPEPAPKARAQAIWNAMQPFSAIKPVLTSRYMVKGWLDREALSVVYGESNVGKTFFALDMALHVAAGEPWYGAKVQGGLVVYIAAEGGSGLASRIDAFKREKSDLAKRIAEEGNFELLSLTMDFCAPGDGEALADVISSRRPRLIIVDTLARSMGNGDENTAQDMGRFVKNMDFIRAETGAHVMVIHHSGKDASKGARGSGALRAAVDTEIELTRDEMIITAEAKKQRDMATGQTFSYMLEPVFLGKDEDGDAVTSCIVTPCDAPAKSRKPKLAGKQKIAMQALQDAMSQHGEVKQGDMFPASRTCVSVDLWRDYCQRHSLSDGDTAASFRMAFKRAKESLHDKERIRVVDGYVWICDEEDVPSVLERSKEHSERGADGAETQGEQRNNASHVTPRDGRDGGQSSVTNVTPPYKGCYGVTVTQPDADEDPDAWRGQIDD